MNLWELALSRQHVHRFSTIFTAEQIQRDFSAQQGIDEAIDWCRRTAVTKAYIESFRSGVEADRDILTRTMDCFERAGIKTAGCVTPTIVGKPSTGWRELISCYTDLPTQAKVRGIFERAASTADEIMIDDFWFTDCVCPQCNEARQRMLVRIGDESFPVCGDTWEDYRCELMVQLSRKCVLEAARRVNPKVKLIIKYPQWYDRFHLRGYEVLRETADFDITWVGTETRDYPAPASSWGPMPQYEAYFIMRWLGNMGGAKCGGGWYDPFGTTEHTYIEQARQTILGGARESVLFCYRSLLKDTGPRNIEVLRQHVPELLDVAEQVARRKPVGIAAYKPANSQGIGEAFVFDFIGMLGLPLLPCHEFPADAGVLLLSTHALKDGGLVQKLNEHIARSRPVLLTDGLADRLPPQVDTLQRHVQTLKVKGDPAGLLRLSQETLDALREPLLKPLGLRLRAPNGVGFYPFTDGSWVLENFTNTPVTAEVNGQAVRLPARGWSCHWE